mgnify:CR=1 FL=1
MRKNKIFDPAMCCGRTDRLGGTKAAGQQRGIFNTVSKD